MTKPKNPSRKKRPSAGKISPARRAALQMLLPVFAGQSLSAVQPAVLENIEDRRDRALAGELANGVLRWRWQLAFIAGRLLSKALKAKDRDVQLVILMALYELQQGRAPDYAIINEAVELVRQGVGKGKGKQWAASMVNAVLRRFTREKETLLTAIDNDVARYSHPQWLLDMIRQDWPGQWQSILQAANMRPPLWLRVNTRQYSAAQYQALLAEHDIETTPSQLSAQALRLEQGMDVRQLPGFDKGAVSVQDAGAQLAANLLNVEAGQRVLDLCAAPGGKACHLLELHEDIELVAVELEEKRMQRVKENLQRLRLEAGLKVADARDTAAWWSGKPFERIMLDAPCSATGVIRRHPDIKSLRREEDIAALQKLQAEILDAAWQTLAEGGELLYITCSILQAENARQIAAFLQRHENAQALAIDVEWGIACEHGRQLLPGEQDADGFYYCRLQKRAGGQAKADD